MKTEPNDPVNGFTIGTSENGVFYLGLSKREHFAIELAKAIIIKQGPNSGLMTSDIEFMDRCVQRADALIIALNK